MDGIKRLLVDMSSVCWMALYAGEDKEFGRKIPFKDKMVQVNSAAYGYENAMNHIVHAMKTFDIVPKDVILVVEGENSKSLRQAILPSYKDTRETRPIEAYDEFNQLKEMLVQTFLDLGGNAVTQPGIEADDVLTYLAQNLQGERYILTNDKDLCRVVDPANGIHVYRRDELDPNPLGPFDHKYITLYLALVGDSDEFPGAKGFGPKAFLDTLCVFGNEGLDAFEALIRARKLDDLAENVPELKVLQKVIDAKDMVYKSYDCARLYPEKVNTLRRPLEWRAGMVKHLRKDTDERVRMWAGRVKLVHADNYAEAVGFMRPLLEKSPFVALDIETSTCDESDDWLAAVKKRGSDDEKLGVDVFGSELTSIGITFGDNLQYTLYFTVDHAETSEIRNISKGQMLDVLKLIPNTAKLKIDTVVHNDSFELPVLYKTFQDDEEWQNNGWHGFLPNVRDSLDAASYVDENQSLGLKKLSKRLLNYDQDTYDTTTTIVFTDPSADYIKAEGEECTVLQGKAPWPGGKLVAEGDGWVKRRYRMNEMPAQHVLHYGADDPICTAALYNHFRIIMEIEKTWDVFLQVEQKPAYLTALGFIQGVPFSLEKLKEREREDDAAYDAAWKVVRDYLIAKGWEGTVCPVYEELSGTTVKEAIQLVTGYEFTTRTRTVAKFPPLIEAAAAEWNDPVAENKALIIARLVENEDLDGLNKLVADNFTGEPNINFDAPKQMSNLLYNVMGLPVRLVNKLTPKERETKPDLAKAVAQYNKIRQGSKGTPPLTDEQKELLKQKATADDDAVAHALVFDADEEQKALLNAITTCKKVQTKRKLYYRPYPLLMHWIDGKLHSSLNQNAAVTRRYSSSGPNLQQLPKKGEGVKVREIIVPHRKGAVIVSIDFSGQELRLMAGQSKDKNMLACYIGEKKKDIHSITASGAMAKKWTKAVVDEFAAQYGADLDPKDEDFLYDLFVTLHKKVKDDVIHKKADDLRKDAKNVNFAAQFDAQALKLATMLIMSVEDAQGFLDAKMEMFPDVETWKDKVRAFVTRTGYATTMMGARRHLRDSVLHPDKWIAEKAGRQGPNFGIQGSAAEMTKLAMARFWDTGAVFKYDARFIAPIHDELVASVAIEDALPFIKAMHEAMTAPYADLCVPVMGSISLGTSFGHQIECGDWFIEENIVAALNKCKELEEAALEV